MRIVGISDSPKLTTGFGNVANEIYKGFHEQGWDLTAFGILDWEPDYSNKLPYNFWPSTSIDQMGYQESLRCIEMLRPEIVWLMADPGNVLGWTVRLAELKERKKVDFKVLAYPPIEGFPTSEKFIRGFEHIVEEHNGDIVLWCDSARKVVKAAENSMNFDWIYFGGDHANFRPYEDLEIKKLRYNVNLHDKFVVGSIGVNKRTKGFDILVYTAAYLKSIGEHEDILFYCHTDRDIPVMQGYDLYSLTQQYDVAEMFLWKPVPNLNRGNQYYGIPRSGDNLDELLNKRRPRSKNGRGALWTEYDFITRMNCFDLYVDTSRVEGWGLPVGEAMSCGIPVLMPDDKHVRMEVFSEGATVYKTTPYEEWHTWHSGARLLGVNPEILAMHILEMKDAGRKFPVDELRLRGKRGQHHMEQYTWDKTREQMNRKVEELYGKS